MIGLLVNPLREEFLKYIPAVAKRLTNQLESVLTSTFTNPRGGNPDYIPNGETDRDPDQIYFPQKSPFYSYPKF